MIHYSGGEESQIFTISSAVDGRWLGPGGKLTLRKNRAAGVKITFLGNGKGYTLHYASSGNEVLPKLQGSAPNYQVYSVTYHS